MRLQSLHIQRLAGIDQPLSISDLPDGLTVVSGPNASGKSSLIRALRHLLAPAGNDPAGLVLAADIWLDGALWRVERTGSSIEWFRDGKPQPPPPLPDPDALDAYLLQVDNLLRASRDDEKLTRRFLQTLAGGFDLSALASEKGPFHVQPGRDRQLAQQLRDAESQLSTAIRENRRLLDERRRLPELETRIGQAEQAGRIVTRCDSALAWLEARRQRLQMEERLNTYPPGMEHCPAPTTLEDTEAAQSTARKRLNEAQQDEADARERLRSSGFTQTGDLPDSSLARSWLDRLKRLDDQLARAREDQAAADATCSDRRPAATAPEQDLLAPGPEWLRAVEQAADSLNQARERLRLLDAEDASRNAGEADARDMADQRRGQRRQYLLGSTLIVAGCAPALGLVMFGGDGLLRMLAVIGVLLLLAGLAVIGRPHFTPQPQSRAGAARALRDQAEQDAARAHDALSALAVEAGLPLEGEILPGTSLRLAHQLHDLDQLSRTRASAMARVRELESQHGKLREQLHGYLADFDLSPGAESDTDRLTSACDALESRTRIAREARAELQRTARAIQQHQDDLHQAQERLAALYQACGLDVNDRVAMDERIRMRDAWQQASEAYRQAMAGEQSLARQLAQDDALREAVEADDEATIRAERDRAAQDAEDLHALMDRRASLQAELRGVEAAHPLERARAERDQLRDDLSRRRNERMRAELGRWLVTTVESENRRLHQPEAVRLADDYLRTFTHHRFALELDEAGQPCARHLATGERRSLPELSVGTRMQLLIALRVAWARTREGNGPRMPLFLDEALTTTDPERFNSIAQALGSLAAKDQRQIIYLTAQPEDAERWRMATGEPPHRVVLGGTDGGTRMTAEQLRPIAAPRIPPPADADAAAYSEHLAVPPIVPADDPGLIHIFHLLRDDLPLLHRLLQDYRVETLGQLESLLTQQKGMGAVPTEKAESLHHRCGLAREWCAAWRRGRGRPVDRTTLEQSVASGWSTLIGPLAERAKAVDGDADRLMQSLQQESIHGLGKKRLTQLQEWFLDEGYLDPTPRYDRDGRHRAVTASLSAEQAGDAAELINWLESAVPSNDPPLR